MKFGALIVTTAVVSWAAWYNNAATHSASAKVDPSNDPSVTDADHPSLLTKLQSLDHRADNLAEIVHRLQICAARQAEELVHWKGRIVANPKNPASFDDIPWHSTKPTLPPR